MAITQAALTNGDSDTDATSYSSASITPTGNRLVLAVITASSAAGSPAPTVTGNGLTWVQVATILFTDGFRRISVFRAMGASPSAGAVTFDFGADTQLRGRWAINEFDGIDTGGTNGSAAIVQSATNSAATVNTLTVTLAAFGSADNATFGGFGTNTRENITPGTGFTELVENFGAAEFQEVYTEWRVDNDTTVDCSWTTTANVVVGGIAIEIKAAAAGATAIHRYLPLLGVG